MEVSMKEEWLDSWICCLGNPGLQMIGPGLETWGKDGCQQYASKGGAAFPLPLGSGWRMLIEPGQVMCLALGIQEW